MRHPKYFLAVLFTLQCFVACTEDEVIGDDDDDSSSSGTMAGTGGNTVVGPGATVGTGMSVGTGGGMATTVTGTGPTTAVTTGGVMTTASGTTSATTTTTTTTGGMGGMMGTTTTTTTGAGGTGGGMTTGGDCTMPIQLGNGAMVSVNGDTTGQPDVLAGSCADTSGPELVYAYTAPTTGLYAFRLITPPTGQMGPGADLGISVRTTCTQVASELNCSDNFTEGTEALNLDLTQGTTYFVLIDGWSNTDEGAFTLEVEQIPDETNCTDGIDNDFDGLIDCADPSNCQNLADCTPGATTAGNACMMANQCVATPNDPFCLTGDLGWPNGYCSEFCDLLNDDCPAGAFCASFGLPNDVGLCVETCTTVNDCQNTTQYRCENIGPGTDLCLPESCGTAQPLVLGTNTGDTSMGGVSTHESSCQMGGTPEAVYTYVASANGTLTLTLTSMADLGLHVRTTCNDDTTEVACVDASAMPVETLPLTVTAGTTYTIFVDGWTAGESGPFTLDASFQ
ncbi:MAG: hypothetical protein AAGN82_24295 [Myxococcota bacterium]